MKGVDEIYKVLYFGTWGYGGAGLEALFSIEEIEIAAVFSRWGPDSQSYLNRVHNLCVHRGIKIIDARKDTLKKAEFEKKVLDYLGEVDFLVSCCFDRIFSESILKVPKVLAMNVHPSFLPFYRGIKPLENAIIRFESRVGVTIHELTKELDAGDVLLQENSIEVKNEDTYKYLYDRQCGLIKKLIMRFFGDPFLFISRKTPQNGQLATYAPRLNIQITDDDRVEDIRKRFAELGASKRER